MAKVKSAFTLAEVLITLGVIGVVAAMTLPSLVNKYQEQATVVRLKKVYNILNNAYRLSQVENGGWTSVQFSETDTVKNHELFFNLLKPYLKVSKICGAGQGCLQSGYLKSLTGQNYTNYDETLEYKVIMADGTALIFYIGIPNENHEDFYGNVKVDINGKQGPYVWGRDVFLFAFDSKKGFTGNPTYSFEEYCNLEKRSPDNGIGCTEWVIVNGNMDYLHCNDLSWSGKRKCSDK